MKELRKKRGWSAAHLAGEMKNVGVPWDRSIVASLELGRRASVTVEELFALAYVLSVAPINLVMPADEAPTWYRVVPEDPPVDALTARHWVMGLHPIGDPRIYYNETPPSTREALNRRLAEMGNDGRLSDETTYGER